MIHDGVPPVSSSVVEREFTVPSCEANADGSHVAKTDDIKDFVIIEESSIAKGIRRVIAVTGHEAHEVSRQAVEFEKRLSTIESLQGKEKDAAMKPWMLVCLTYSQGTPQLTFRNSVKAVSRW